MADDTASSGRPQPVLYSQLATVLAALLGLLTAFGLKLDADQQKAILAVVSALVPLIALAAAWWARQRVTPLADPRDNKGRRLVAQSADAQSADAQSADVPPAAPEPPVVAPRVNEAPVIAPPGSPPLPPPPSSGRRRRP